MTTLLVGHVTKEGSIAGPRALEHLVDVVGHFSGTEHSRLRLFRAIKNRYGPTDEVGCFDLHEGGIVGLLDPSGLFTSHTDRPVSGTCTTVALEGRRPLVAEIQALTFTTNAQHTRKATSGLDSARVALLLAVLHKHTQLTLSGDDYYVATLGGVLLREPATDLATALALVSAKLGQALPPRLVAFGEVGLTGAVRPVPHIDQRLQEAQRLGLTCAVVPSIAPDAFASPENFQVYPVSHLVEALEHVFSSPAAQAPEHLLARS